NLLRMLYSRAGDYPKNQPLLYAESFSPNTPEGACPECHGLGRIYTVTEESMVPDPTFTIRERAVAAWPPAWHGQNLRDTLVTLGYDVDRPWKDLPRKDRDWILFTDETPTVPVYPGFTPAETRAALKRKEEPGYMGTFSSARRYVMHTFANTQSPLMKKRVSRYMLGADCPVCRGKRLRREALSVKFAGLDIAQISRLPLKQLAAIVEPYAKDRDHARRRARACPQTSSRRSSSPTRRTAIMRGGAIAPARCCRRPPMRARAIACAAAALRARPTTRRTTSSCIASPATWPRVSKCSSTSGSATCRSSGARPRCRRASC